MRILTEHPTIDSLLEEWEAQLGRDYLPYRNHVYRVFNLAFTLAEAAGEELEKLSVAAAFHDVGIWLDETFDYLEPSIKRAKTFLSDTRRFSHLRPQGAILIVGGWTI